MLNRTLIVWIAYALLMGFALGGSFVSAYLTPPPQHHSSVNSENGPSDQDAKEKTDEAIARYTLWLMVFTAVLAFATVGLGIATVGLYVTGEKQVAAATKAANAADMSARAAIGIELPRIRMKPDDLSSGDERNGDEIIVSYWVGGITFANYGRTSAFPIEIKCGMTLEDTLPAEPTYPSVETFLPVNEFKPPPPKPEPHETPRKRLSNCSIVVQDDDGDKIRKGETNLWFYCNLAYNDFMDVRREISLCWRWTNVGLGMAWRSDTSTAYNRKT